MLIGYDSNNALSLSVFLPLSLTSHATSMLVPLLVIVTQPFFSVRAARRNRNHCRDAVRAAFRFATREWILSVTTRTWHRHLITNNNNESNENNDDKAHRSYEGYTQTTMTMMKSVPAFFALLLTTTISSVAGFAVLPTAIPRGVGRTTTTSCDAFSTSGMWNAGLSFGKGQFRFYTGFEEWMSPFPAEDRAAYPEIFTLPAGVREVVLTAPLGIIFEEVEAGKGVYVMDLVEGGAAEKQGTIEKGDLLVGVTAIKVVGAKWERRLIPARSFDFDTVVGAIQSNNPKWGCNDVILMFERPSESDKAKTDEFLQFFNPPGDSPWRQQQ